MFAFDPFALDRALSAHAKRHHRWCEALRRGTARDHAFELLPDGISRDVARELAELGKSDPFAAAAARWMAFLLGEHATIEARLGVASAERKQSHALDFPERGTWSIADMVERMLVDGARRSGWLAALSSSSAELGARRLSLFELQNERRPARLEASAATLSAARDFLERTRDAYAEVRVTSLPRFIELGLGSDVPGDFPATLTARRLADFFREGRLLDGLSPELGALPRVLGASSTLRGLSRFGRALHDAGARSGPFVMAHDPHAFRGQSYGHLFAFLPFHASFAERRLDVGRGRVTGYRRALARVLLLGARLHVGRALLAHAAANGAAAYRAAFEEELPQALGFELDPRLAGALFVDESGVSAVAALFAASERDRLFTERHDEDWFRNPRCLEELRGELDSPPPVGPSDELVASGAVTLAAALTAAS
jgi:hypothetical protein